MLFRKSWFTFAAIALGASLIAPPVHSVATEDEQYPSLVSSAVGAHSIEMNEVSGLRDNVSVLVGKDDAGIDRICSSASSAPCNSSKGYYFRAVLEPCSASVTVDCIESVTATSNGVSSNGVFSQFFPLKGVTDFTGSETDGVPNGVAPSMWDFPSVPHAFGSKYQVTVQVTGMKTNGDALKPLRTFFANITPVSVSPVQCTVQGNGHCMDTFYEDSNSGKIRFAGVAADQDAGVRCQNWGENSQCALKHAFPAGVTFGLKVRLRTVPTGWLHGRLNNPTASIVTADGVTTVSISAAPTRVPVAAASANWSALPTNIQAWFDANCPSNCGTRQPGSLSLPGAQRNAMSGPLAYSATSFEQLALWKDFMQDKAYAVPSIWNVRTLSYGEMEKAPACIKDGKGVTGIVSTNSTLYAEGPPAFNSADSTLDYKVAALHYERDGTTPFLGNYSLLLRDDIAKCLYNAPLFAGDSAVTVTAENGTTSTATTSFTQEGGWVKFVASGYTHSSPTLRAKLIPKWPSVKKGKKISGKSIAKTYGVSIPSKAKLTLTVVASSKKVCSVTGTSVVGTKKGTCRVKISVTPAKTKKVPKPKTVSQTVKVVVN